MAFHPLRLLFATAVLLAAAPAGAEDPKYDYRAPPAEAKGGEPATVWKANIQAGLIWVSGNAESIGFSGSAKASVKHEGNLFELFAQGAYAEAGTSDIAGGPITGRKTAAQNWLGRLRYDRFFSAQDSVFASLQVGGDRLAGISYRVEPQLGYARIFFTSKVQTLRGEAGYDYSYERYLAGTSPIDAGFHSARLFLFYENKFTPYASFSEGLEALEALNKLEHFRLNSLTSLSSTVSEHVALKLNLTVKFNNDPPARPPPNLGVYQKVDTTLEAVLAVSFG